MNDAHNGVNVDNKGPTNIVMNHLPTNVEISGSQSSKVYSIESKELPTTLIELCRAFMTFYTLR